MTTRIRKEGEPDREERLGKALRDNLRRRKSAARKSAKPDPGKDGDPGKTA